VSQAGAAMSGTRPGPTPTGPGKAEEGPRRRAPRPFAQSLGTPALCNLMTNLLIARQRAVGPVRLAIGQLLADLRAVSEVRWDAARGNQARTSAALGERGTRPHGGARQGRDEATPTA
jgi:hypothetical protein